MSKVFVFANMGAGGAKEDSRAQLEEAFAASGLEYELIESEDGTSIHDLAEKALAEGAEHLCACGGDGTVAQVLNAILAEGRERAVLSIIPRGTGNLIAEALGIPGRLEEAVEVVRGGRTREIDVGKIEGKYFALGLGLGATERFVTQTGDRAKKVFGRLAYAFSLLKHTEAPRHRLRIEVDGKPAEILHAEAATLANFVGTPRLKLIKDSKPDDGLMELVINERLTRWGLVRLMWHGLWGGLHHDGDVRLLRGSHFQIEADPALPIQLDGNETDLKTPASIEVLPRALRVCVPPRD